MPNLIKLAVVLIFFFSSQVNAQLADNADLNTGRIHAFLGWTKDLKTYHFEQAAYYIDKTIASLKRQSKNSFGYTRAALNRQIKELEIESALNKQRAKTFQDFQRNRYPMVPVVSGGYSFQELYWNPDLLAVKESTEELLGNIKLTSTGKGQTAIFTMTAGNSTPEEVSEYAHGIMQRLVPYGAYPTEELYRYLEKVVTLKEIRDNPYLLNRIIQKEKFNYITIFHYERMGIVDETVMYTGTVSHYDPKKPGQLETIAIADGFGQNTREIWSSSFKYFMWHASAGLLLFILFTFVALPLLYKTDLADRMRALAILIVLAGLGVAAGFGAGYGSVLILDDYKAPTGLSTILILLATLLLNLVIILLITTILNKVERFSVLANHPAFLPAAFMAFYAGVGIYFVFELYYYKLLYPDVFRNQYPVAVVASLSSAGIVTGAAMRILLSRKAVPVVRLVVAGFYLITGVSVLTLSAERYLSAELTYLFHIGAALVVFLIVFELIQLAFKKKSIKNDSDFQLGILQQKEVEIPQDFQQLRQVLENPGFIKLDNLSLEKGISSIEKALEEEGGVVLLRGSKGAGKSRYARELLKLKKASGSMILNIQCEAQPQEKDRRPYTDFLEGLFALKEDEGGENGNARISKNIREASGKLAEPVAAIPVLGPVLKVWLENNSDALLQQTDPAEIKQFLTREILRISRQLITDAAKEEEKHLIIFIDNYEFLDEESRKLILSIQDLLRNSTLSSESNPVAFLACETVHSRNQTALFDDVLASGFTEVIDIPGFNHKQMTRFFFKRLGFSTEAEALLERIYLRLERNGRVTPGAFIESLKRLLSSRCLIKTGGGFKQAENIDLNFLPIAPKLLAQNRKVLEVLTDEEINVLQASACIGVKFNSKQVSHLLKTKNFQVITILDRIVQKSGYIQDLLKNNGTYTFKNFLAWEVVWQSMHQRVSHENETIMQPRQLLSTMLSRMQGSN